MDGQCVAAVGDIQLDLDFMNLFLQQVPAYTNPCMERVGCLGASEGLRWVLRFNLTLRNVGEGTVVVVACDAMYMPCLFLMLHILRLCRALKLFYVLPALSRLNLICTINILNIQRIYV